jgi:hypothetical protein
MLRRVVGKTCANVSEEPVDATLSSKTSLHTRARTHTHTPDHTVSNPTRRQTTWRFDNFVSDTELSV